MKIAAIHSHLNGSEYLTIRRRKIWKEVLKVISEIDLSEFQYRVKGKSINHKKRQLSTSKIQNQIYDIFSSTAVQNNPTP